MNMQHVGTIAPKVVDVWTWWRNALAGNFGPIHSEPQWGYYRTRAKDGPWEPVAIWQDEEGNWLAYRNGREVQADAVWTWCCRNPIEHAAYEKAMAGGGFDDEPPAPRGLVAVMGDKVPRDFTPALPDALESEQALLGALLVSNDVYWRVAGFLKPEHFTEPLHKLIYDTAGKMIAEGRTANPLTMKPYVPAEEAFGQKTVAHYLATLAGSAVTVINAYEYGRAIVEMWARHRLISVAVDLDQMARNMPVDMNPEKIIGEVAGRLTQIAQEGNERAGSVPYREDVRPRSGSPDRAL